MTAKWLVDKGSRHRRFDILDSAKTYVWQLHETLAIVHSRDIC